MRDYAAAIVLVRWIQITCSIMSELEIPKALNQGTTNAWSRNYEPGKRSCRSIRQALGQIISFDEVIERVSGEIQTFNHTARGPWL